ncbi:MAG: ribosome recycling factor [Candidatus Levybacteria bacterium RIFCSPHIGHO2_01_FULL_37_17]|nr:MAG: ribosome recycling factor [Candidatus Levybacteria bacterium RIFCSPHIGHO2_01_FULL_37_17]OGH36891.1 MAG: ribosome recycling factor [Candidatus Levybacteria bacterium RIFCSPLOWO2_01_FULL_38_23]
MNLDSSSQKMNAVLDVIKADLATVRAGKASPALVENLVVAAYGGTQRLKVVELAQIAAIDAQTLVITPFDGSIIGEIHKAIQESGTGFNPVIDGQLIRISIPPLSEERRQELVHLVNQKLEGGRIQVRQVRHELMDEIKKQFNDKEISEDDKARLEKEAQRLTDETISQIDNLGKQKEQELMSI